MLPALLNSPRGLGDWQRWSFDDAQDHRLIIQKLRDVTGSVTSVTLTNGGSGYTSIPSITLDSYGVGASFSVTGLGGVLKTIALTSGGVGYHSDFFEFSGGGGTGATATITVSSWVSLPIYQLDPINFQSPAEFFRRHAQTHTEMNGALGLQSIDLSEVDLRDENKIQAWIYGNYQEHNNVHNRLGI